MNNQVANYSALGDCIKDMSKHRKKIFDIVTQMRKKLKIKKPKRKRAYSQLTSKEIEEYYNSQILKSRKLENLARDKYST